MKIQLHDNRKHLNFAPLSLTRPIGDIRIGILTNAERWQKFVPDATITFGSEEYLAAKFNDDLGDVVVNACLIPTKELVEKITSLKGNEELVSHGKMLAKRGTGEILVQWKEDVVVLEERWDIFQKNGEVMLMDFDLITEGKTSVQLSSTNTIIGDANRNKGYTAQ